MRNRKWLNSPPILLQIFIIVNLTFLAIDVYMAHSVNAFAHRAEWIPVLFSLATPPLLLVAALSRRRRVKRFLALGVGWGCVLIGIGGML